MDNYGKFGYAPWAADALWATAWNEAYSKICDDFHAVGNCIGFGYALYSRP
jgi:hypothetical protein